MAIDSDFLKQILSDTYKVDKKQIKRKSKKKDELKNNVRVFDVDSFEVVVVTDPTDNMLLEYFLSDADVEELITENFNNYLFAVTKLEVGQGLIYIVKKSFWEENKVLNDQPLSIKDYLPLYIEEVKGDSISELICPVLWRHAEVIQDLTSKGLIYSNDVAMFINKTFDNPNYHCVFYFKK